MRFDAYCSWPHYVEHLAPIWLALPAEVRGTFFIPQHLREIAARLGVDVTVNTPARRGVTDPVLVASFTDHELVRPRPTVLLNHGAGQSYVDGPGRECFSGGPGRERVLLHLEPGRLAARATRAAYPDTPIAEVGSVRLDPWHRHERPWGSHAGIVAVGMHHDCRGGSSEQRSAWVHYADAIAELSKEVQILGHGHPRWWGHWEKEWGKLGVEYTADFAEVLDRADVYVTDVSSTGVEMASTGRPVIWCSAPWYRRAIEHGGRFWSWVRVIEGVGGHVTDPAELRPAVEHALASPAALRHAQRAIVAGCYRATDGRAVDRAVEALLSLPSGSA